MGSIFAGFGRTNITPKESLPLASYGNAESRWFERILSELYYTAIAVKDSEGRVLLLTTYDITQCSTEILAGVRKGVAEKCGINPECIHLSGTHTHSSVEVWMDIPAVREYNQFVIRQGILACEMALADLAPAELYAGETKTERLNCVRHYYRADGTVTGDNYGNISDAPIVSHVAPADETMRVVRFKRTRADGSPARDIVLVNWQAHNHLTGGFKKKDLSADFSGALRSYTESKHDCFCTFFQGCAGNLNEKSRIESENRTSNYLEHGRLLSEYVDGIYDSLEKVDAEFIRSITRKIQLKTAKPDPELVRNADKVNDFWEQNDFDGIKTARFAEPFGIHSVFHARAIKRNLTGPDTIEAILTVYRIGDFAAALGSFELFDTTGIKIREASPFKMTFTQGYTDKNNFYLPTREAFEYGCYEADNTTWTPETEEIVRNELISMIKELAEEK